MHKIEVIGTKLKFEFPESIMEFTRSQTIDFCSLLIQLQTNQIDYNKFKTELVYKFLNLKRSANLSNKPNQNLVENINAIGKFADNFFYFDIVEGKKVRRVNLDFVYQKIDHVTVGDNTFFGPTDALFNTNYGEYLKVLSHFKDYCASGDVKDLDLLIATIYRPKKNNYEKIKDHPSFDGDIRIKFNPNLTANYVASLKNLHASYKYAIFLFVASCQHFIANNKALDIGSGNTIDLTQLFNQEPSSKTSSLGMIGTLYSLAETNVFGNVDQVAEKNTYDVLSFLVSQKEQFQNLKSKSNA